MEASSGGHNIPKIMVFNPTMEEFKDFNKYIEYIESKGAHKAGICKIRPPKEWVPRKGGYSDIDIIIPHPIQQVVAGSQGLYTQLNVQKRNIHVRDFSKLATSEKYRTPRHTDYEDLERKYWKNITFINPIYGADVSGSVTDKDQPHWNIQKLGTILDTLDDEYGISIEGVNTAYLYFGMWKTTFAWHTEDMDLYSINYVHFGAPKTWYAIPPEHGRRLERLAAGFFPENFEQCPAFLRHKMTLISPTILRRYSIPYDSVVQEAGEFIVTFPYGYHSGFNHGYNCAESTNFASKRWIEYGKRCVQCHCRKDSVRIDMSAFVRKFQPKLYERWLIGEDIAPHPEDDQSKLYHHPGGPPIGCQNAPLKRQHSVSKVDHSELFMARLSRHVSKRFKLTKEDNDSSSQEHLDTQDRSRLDNGSSSVQPMLQSNNSGKKSPSSRSKVEQKNGSPKRRHNEKKHKCKEELLGVRSTVKTEPNDHSHKALAKEPVNDWQSDASTATTDVCTEPEGNHESDTMQFTNKRTDSRKEKKVNKSKKREKCEKSIDNSGESVLEVPGLFAKRLTKLWRFNSQNFKAEKKFNEKQSQLAPHCAICSILNDELPGQPLVRQPSHLRIPKSSVPLLPVSCFMGADQAGLDGVRVKGQGKAHPLLICADCRVCVHDCCYGVTLPAASQTWKCSRCALQIVSAECALCCLRGGALKPAQDGRWCHVTCAIAHVEVTFKNVNQREPVILSQLSHSRASLKCAYCGLYSHRGGKDKFGMCIQCSVGKCTMAFHLTCARMANINISVGHWPLGLYVTCSKHSEDNAKLAIASSDRPILSVGDAVYGKHKNKRYYRAVITKINTQEYYCVLFDDNSFSSDLYPEDIVNFRGKKDGPPPLGSFVQVKWTDDKLYNGVFQGPRSALVYSVEFEDGSESVLERDHLYGLDEPIPLKVQKKLSQASEMKTDVFYKSEEELLVDKRTRGVQVNYHRQYSP